MRHSRSIFLLALALTTVFAPAHARKSESRTNFVRTIARPSGLSDNPATASLSRGLSATAGAETTWLLTSNFNGATCTPMGWTTVDLTVQSGDYWHVDDYAGLPFGPIQGSKSLWLGTRPGTGFILCTYQTLPGYGNLWNQSWCTRDCLDISGGPTPQLDVSFALHFDSEQSYDGTVLEYTSDCSGNYAWTEIDGGVTTAGWSGVGQVSVDGHYSVGSGPVRVRLHFSSDSSWSDQDGYYDSFSGAASVDSLKAETLPLELFEDESVGATSSNDWQSCNTPGFGDYAGLFKGSDVLQEDACLKNVSCLWAFIQGSTANYACGGHPEQVVVPFGPNSRDESIMNEIWSPVIPLNGAGSVVNLQYDVYRDLPLLNEIFYVWHVRSIVDGCPTPWVDRNFLYFGDDKSWYRQTDAIGTKVNITTASAIQVALGIIDMCPFWCGVLGSGTCHSQAPLFDNIKVYRVNISGPQWDVRDIDLFQDTFAADGTITGTARADIASDIRPSSSPYFTPGDSALVYYLVDANYAGTGTDKSGLSNDPNISTFIGRDKTKKQVYMWVAVWPQGQPNKSGDGLSEGPGGQANRYPHIAAKDYVDASGVTWTAIRADYTYSGTYMNPGDGHPAPNPTPLIDNRFNVDLNDNLFTPGDTVCFFFGATSPGGTTYFSDQWHFTNDIAEVAANPMEFTVLPAGGFNRGSDILYVDGADGYGVQPYWDGAFLPLGFSNKVDRYDVRGPASADANTLAGRVTNVAQQLNACYRFIAWDCGSLPVTLGDGTGIPSKVDDYALLNNFLGNLFNPGGLLLMGDDMAQNLAASPSASTGGFKDYYMPFTLLSGDHIADGLGVSPAVVHWPGRAFSDDFIAFGGCPELNDFDVLGAFGTSRTEMSYTTAMSANGAVLSNVNGSATVLLCGFSMAEVRDDELNGVSDRAKFFRDAYVFTGAGPSAQPTGAGPVYTNNLSQNYPNPFNPQTTIAFSVKNRVNVRLAVYDVNGALVRTLVNSSQAAGPHEMKWDGRDDRGAAVASGVYFYRLRTGDFTSTKKMVLLK